MIKKVVIVIMLVLSICSSSFADHAKFIERRRKLLKVRNYVFHKFSKVVPTDKNCNFIFSMLQRLDMEMVNTYVDEYDEKFGFNIRQKANELS